MEDDDWDVYTTITDHTDEDDTGGDGDGQDVMDLDTEYMMDLDVDEAPLCTSLKWNWASQNQGDLVGTVSTTSSIEQCVK